MVRLVCTIRLAVVFCFLVLTTGCGGSGGGGAQQQQNPTPLLTALNPASATAGSAATTVTLAGSGFIANSVVDWNGSALSTTYVSSTSLTAQVPASDLTTTGTASVTVVNPTPGGGSSSAQTFTINPVPNPAPTLTSLSPSSAVAGSAATALALTGTGFLASSVVDWNGSALTTTYVSGTSLTAQIPASDLAAAGTASVTVVNPTPGGGTSSAQTFTINPVPNPVPTLSSLSPSSAIAGSAATTLALTGTGFLASSVVDWNGSALTTTYVSGTSLTAQIPASDLAAAGTANVTVVNPIPGGGTSNSESFVVNGPTTVLNILNVSGSDIAWNPTAQKFYVAVPATASVAPGTILVVDPIAGTVGNSVTPSAASSGLAISDDDSYLYAAINQGASIQRFTLPALTPDIQWSLPASESAEDIAVQPGSSHTVAVSMGNAYSGATYYGIYDDGVERASVGGDGVEGLGNSLEWSADGTQLSAGYAVVTDAAFYTTTSDAALWTMPVTQTGVGAITAYNSAFRYEGAHLHLDPASGFSYDDWGEVVNSATGAPVGNYRWPRPSSTIFPGPLSVLDPKLGRYYILLEVSEPDGTGAFQVQSFSQANFQHLSTMVIPNVSGTPRNFIRWGQSGLALITADSYNNSAGRLYLLDGYFVNPSGVFDTSAGTPQTPVPALTSLSPVTTAAGSSSLTLTITGRDFTPQSTVFWGTTSLATTEVSGIQLTAEVPASLLVSSNQATITVSNSSSDVPQSNALPFSVDPAPPAANTLSVYNTGGLDLVWAATAGKIYVSMPGTQGDAGDAIGIVDPVAGTVASSGFIGSDPDQLSLSSDGNYLYTGLDGQNSIAQLALPAFQVNTSWNLGADSFDGPYYALDIEAAPGAPQTTAVTLANFDRSPSAAGVLIYDGSTARPDELLEGHPPNFGDPSSSVQWNGSDSTLYAIDQYQDFMVFNVSSAGVTVNNFYNNFFSSGFPRIHYDAGTGLIYTDGGQVINPSNATIIGNFGSSGIAVPDSSLNLVFILGQTSAQTNTSSYTIASFNQTTFAPVGSMTVDNVVGTPTGLIRWGSNGLAFTTLIGSDDFFLGYNEGPGQLYVISGAFVNAPVPAAKSSSAARFAPVRRTWGISPVSSDPSIRGRGNSRLGSHW